MCFHFRRDGGDKSEKRPVNGMLNFDLSNYLNMKHRNFEFLMKFVFFFASDFQKFTTCDNSYLM